MVARVCCGCVSDSANTGLLYNIVMLLLFLEEGRETEDESEFI